MRRLQSNLAYLAAIADRSHKPSSQIPPHPQIMLAPAFTTRTKVEDEKDDKVDGVESNKERIDLLNKQYTRLQELFPGADLQKERNAMKQQAAVAQANQARNNPATGGDSTAKVRDDANSSGAIAANQEQEMVDMTSFQTNEYQAKHLPAESGRRLVTEYSKRNKSAWEEMDGFVPEVKLLEGRRVRQEGKYYQRPRRSLVTWNNNWKRNSQSKVGRFCRRVCGLHLVQ